METGHSDNRDRNRSRTSMMIIILIGEIGITFTDKKENRIGEPEKTATTIEETGQLQGVENLIEKLHQIPRGGAGIMIREMDKRLVV
jgi:hypothetical protein